MAYVDFNPVRANIIEGNRRIISYVVAEAEYTIDIDAVKVVLQQKMPDYMVPSGIIVLAELPLNQNGKVDWRALPIPEKVFMPDHMVAPRNQYEKRLAAIWRGVLGIESISVEDNFFSLGGHSLLATQVLSRIREEFDTELALRVIFEAPTLALLALAVEQQQTDVVAALPDIEVVSREQNLLVSFAQERMWFLHQFDPENSSYHIPAAIRLKGQLDVNALAHVFTDIVKRHEILHCSIAEVNGVPVLNFNDHAFKVERHDIHHMEAIAGRTRKETEGLIGLFVNTIIIRSDLSEN